MALQRRSLLTGLGVSLAQPPYSKSAGTGSKTIRLRISLADLGAQPNTTDVAPFFTAALARLPRTGGAVLHIPRGTWHFAQAEGTAVSVQEFDDITIESDGG